MLSALRSLSMRYAVLDVSRPLLSSSASRWLTESGPEAEGAEYSYDLKFTTLAETKPMHVFRTLSDMGAPWGNTVSEKAFGKDLALQIYRVMLRLHVADTLFYEAQRQGRLSFYVTSFGEEAVTVASAAALDLADESFLQYREHGFLMWRGFSIRQMADQCYGNALECGKGRQMPIHYGSPELHVHTISSVLATQIPHAVGAAFALKAERKPNVAVTFFGDGAASEGDFHASLNFAATLELPVLFICRNNGYAISTPTSEQFKTYCVGIRGPSYGIPTIRIDGGDPRAVYMATTEARRMALEQSCPILIEAMCYRAGHHSTSDDSTRYRRETETNLWKAREPVGRFFHFLSGKGWWSQEENDNLQREIRKEVHPSPTFLASASAYLQVIESLDAAQKIPKRPVRDLFTDVYASMPWHLEEQHRELLEFLKVHPDQRPKDIPLE